jgi:hypothetical protein
MRVLPPPSSNEPMKPAPGCEHPKCKERERRLRDLAQEIRIGNKARAVQIERILDETK